MLGSDDLGGFDHGELQDMREETARSGGEWEDGTPYEYDEE